MKGTTMRFIRKPLQIEAVKLAVGAMFGTPGTTGVEAKPGDWLVTFEDGHQDVMTDEALRTKYDEVKQKPAEPIRHAGVIPAPTKRRRHRRSRPLAASQAGNGKGKSHHKGVSATA